MNRPILTVPIQHEQDVVLARQRARQVAELLGFDQQNQTRLATAVSEIARNAFRYAGGGRALFALEGETAPQVLLIQISDRGPGIRNLQEILENRYSSKTGMGLGILGARRLIDRFEIQSAPGKGATVSMRQLLPHQARPFRPEDIGSLAAKLAHDPPNLLEELRRQNADLLATLEELRQRQEELTRLNRELEDTNRGVVALYAELDERADHLRRADEVKTRFLSNMTHEFRTPLNSIQALTRLLLEHVDGELTPEQEKQVYYVQKAAASLSELVNDLLDLAKVAAGKIVVRPEDFEVKDLFGALRGMLRPLLLNTSVSLVFEEPDNLPPLETDEAKVSQIVRNFISNGLKYTEKGEVRVSAKLSTNRRDMVFAVSDTGIGIAPRDQELIFQEFAQIENPLQRKSKGTGLGLPLAKKLAELLGGSVSVQSEPGVGSTFTATIPLIYPGSEPAASIVSAPEPGSKSPVLLLSEDIETRLLYEKFLRGSPFHPFSARGVVEARLFMEKARPAAVILEAQHGTGDLRDGNAWEFLLELKGRDETGSIPVILISEPEDHEKSIALGADAFGGRPVEKRWLIRQLANLTGIHGPGKVLIIDDDELSRYLIRQLFSEKPEIVEAVNGMDGLRAARDEEPDVIVLDLVMPDISGFQVLERLQADSRTSQIPVIISTSRLLDEGDRRRLGRMAGMLLPKSALSDGTAANELHRICNEIGLEEIWGQAATSPRRAITQ
jgi:signal transduction histidine kinase/CheY-like chemotaxis protein